MKRFIIGIMLVLSLIVGCNKNIVDMSYKFDYAMIKLPNGEVINTKIKSWTDGEEDDFGWIQIWTEDNYYYTALENVILSKSEIK